MDVEGRGAGTPAAIEDGFKIRHGNVDVVRVRAGERAFDAGRLDECEDGAATIKIVAIGRDTLSGIVEDGGVEGDGPFYVRHGQNDAKEPCGAHWRG